jgi:sec-independent protein translocase protein TatA
MNIEKDLIILLIVALLVFGPQNLSKIGSAIGKSIRDFRRAMEGEEERHAPANSDPAHRS